MQNSTKKPASKPAPRRSSAPARKPASRPAPARNPAPRSSGRERNVLPLIIAGGIVFIVLCFFLQKYVFPNGVLPKTTDKSIPEIDAAATVRVSEVMSSNASSIQDDTGAYPDWVEIVNNSGKTVNLYGWKLAKDSSLMIKYFEFPNQTLAAGERVLVYCTGTLRNNAGYAYHAPFRISAAGDTLVLFNPNNTAVQTLNVPEMSANQSYAEIGGEWTVTDEATPGLSNTSESYHLLHDNREVSDSPIEITELMAKNMSYAADENGEFLDWIEIHNKSAYTVSLNNYALSDSDRNLQKWHFPNVSIGPDEYMIVYCSGYDRRDPVGRLHTNFRLSSEKEGAYLSNAAGQLIDFVEYDLLKADQSYSRQSDGTWTTNLSPTPGMSNSFQSAALIDGQFAAQNSSGVFFNEIMATTTTANVGKASYDWIELYNATSQTIDLSSWGLSDNPAKPRKWQFPAGTTIAPGQYMGVYCSGLNTTVKGYCHTNFKLSATEGESLVLSDPTGKILDRVQLGMQYSNMPYGRISGRNGFYYLAASTPGSGNVQVGYESRMLKPTFSVQGGMYPANQHFNVALSAEPGATIYYTLDSSTPDPAAVGGIVYTPDPEVSVNGRYETFVYTDPIPVTQTTVIRAIAVKDGQLTSLVETQSYLVGVSHTMQVISLVMNPTDLWDYNTGLYVKGPNALSKSPYGSLGKGANFWMTWEKDANVELFDLDGSTVLSQGCGVRLHGQYSRKEAQKPFKIIARSKYGDSRFRAKLFPNRDYTEYQSFLLRASGQDTRKTRMRDSILTALADGMGVMYQDTNLAIVYLNGEYWGHYNMRERINTFSICQWEGWDPVIKDSIDLVKANTSVMKGSVDSWKTILEWIKKNGVETSEKLEYVKQYIDVDNYLKYIAVEMYTGNTDLLNVKKYRTSEKDGKWRFILFDFDWAFTTNTNSVGRWLKPGGMGEGNKTDNSLFIALMKNPECKDMFLKLFAEKLRGPWSSEAVLARIDERYNELEPEIDQHLEKWGPSRKTYESEINTLKSYARKRPGHLLYYFSQSLSRSDMEYYFGDLLETVTMLDADGKVYNYNK